MVNARGIGRVSTFAVGLGIGAALTHSPVASADAAADPYYFVSALDAAPAATVPSEINFAISFDGMNFIEAGSATATTEEGGYGLSIAIGDHATAFSAGGMFNNAFADGSYALAKAGSLVGGATGGSDYNTAINIGNNSADFLNQADGAYAGGGSLIGNADSGANSHNLAIDIGNNGLGSDSTLQTGYSGALAGDGALEGHSGVGTGNTAIMIGDTNGLFNHPGALAGNDNYASNFGNLTGNGQGALAAFGDNNTAIANANYTTDYQGVFAGAGNGNIGYVDGPDNSVASAGGITTELGWPTTIAGDSNFAAVFDPFGMADQPSHVVAGVSDGMVSSNDLAAVLLTHGVANIGGADGLYEIVTALGTFESNVLAGSADALANWFGTL